MNDLTFNILKIAVSVCSVLVVTYLIPFLRNKINSSKFYEIVDMVNISVRAAEQTITGSGMGSIKKENVITAMNDWLKDKGIKLSEEQVSQLIEAAVYNMNQVNNAW